MDKFREGEDNPFDAPVAGQGLTDEPGNYPWEHPPQFTDVDEAADFVWDRLHRPEFMEQVIAMLDAGIPVEALGIVSPIRVSPTRANVLAFSASLASVFLIFACKYPVATPCANLPKSIAIIASPLY